MKKKVILVFGTRPEAIKMAPLVKVFEKEKSFFETIVCVTGQHKEMLTQVLDIFKIRPKYNLEIMKKNQTLFDINNEVLIGMKNIYEAENPDLVLVHGDTSTTYAAALAAFYMNIDVGHVEAGLRTYNVYEPFPEEFNRQAVSIFAKFNFSPTKRTQENLLREGKNPKSIFITGNTVIDALQTTKDALKHSQHDEWIGNSRLILLTCHRRENLGKPMENIFRAVKRLLKEVNDIKIIYPLHKNPIIHELVEDHFSNETRIKIIPPLDVLEFHHLMKKSYIVMTDSGGIQEEAPSLGKPVIVLRNTTERPEGVEAGTLKLAGTDENNVFNVALELLSNQTTYFKMSRAINPYGDGNASKKIVNIIKNELFSKA